MISHEAPVYHWSDPPDEELGYYTLMEFRLVYEGELKAASNSNSRKREKHTLRKEFHKQLAVLWESHPALARFHTVRRKKTRKPKRKINLDVSKLDENMKAFLVIAENSMRYGDALLESGSIGDPGRSYIETLARNFTRSDGFRFVPLVHKNLHLICGLDILFLRREPPGTIVRHGGDVDNRIKTLLDALKVPESGFEIGIGAKPSANEDPFFCLLEDDSLITELNIRTDRLLTPIKDDGHENDVMLIIQVRVGATEYNHFNRSMAG